jgi:hypothetical protein
MKRLIQFNTISATKALIRKLNGQGIKLTRKAVDEEGKLLGSAYYRHDATINVSKGMGELGGRRNVLWHEAGHAEGNAAGSMKEIDKMHSQLPADAVYADPRHYKGAYKKAIQNEERLADTNAVSAMQKAGVPQANINQYHQDRIAPRSTYGIKDNPSPVGNPSNPPGNPGSPIGTNAPASPAQQVQPAIPREPIKGSFGGAGLAIGGAGLLAAGGFAAASQKRPKDEEQGFSSKAKLIQFMKNPLHREGIKPGTHRLGGVGVERKVRIRDIVSSQALVDEKKVRKLARFTKNMPGKATVSWNGKNWIAKDGNHRLNAMLKQGKRKATVLVQKLSSQQPVIQLGTRRILVRTLDQDYTDINEGNLKNLPSSKPSRAAVKERGWERVIERKPITAAGKPEWRISTQIPTGTHDRVGRENKRAIIENLTHEELSKRVGQRHYPTAEEFSKMHLNGRDAGALFIESKPSRGFNKAHGTASGRAFYEASPPARSKWSRNAKIGAGIGAAALIGAGAYSALRKPKERKLSAKQEPIQFMHNTDQPSPIAIKRRPIKPRNPIQQLSAQLDDAINFAMKRDENGRIIPITVREVMHNTPFETSETGRELFKAATSRGVPTDASGESRIVLQPGGRKLIKISERGHLDRVKHRPGMRPPEPETHRFVKAPPTPIATIRSEGNTVTSPEIRASDLRNEPKFKGVVRRAMEAEHAPKLAEAAAKEKTQAGKDRIYKEAKAAVGKELEPQNIGRKLRDTRDAIAQTARTRREIGSAVSKKIPGLNRTEYQGVVESAHENLKGHLRQALDSRKAQGEALHASTLEKTREALVKSDKRYSPTMHKRDLEKLRISKESGANELMKATFGGGSENPNIDVNAHSKMIGENLQPIRRKYRNLIETPYGHSRTTTKAGKTHLGGSTFKHVQREIIKSGKIFEGVQEATPKISEVNTGLKKFPLARGLGIAAGLAGAGLLARKLMKKKEEPQKQLMSSRSPLIQFGKKLPIRKIVSKVRLSPKGKEMAYRRADRVVDKTLTEAEHKATGGSQWTAPEHRGGAQSVDYSKHAIGNEDEIRKAANLKKRAELPADAPHSLNPNAQTYKDELDAVSQSKNYWQKQAEESQKIIAGSKDPAIRRNTIDSTRKAGIAASKEIAVAREGKQAAEMASTGRVKKAAGRMMGARRAALGRQAEAHAGEMEGARTRMIRNTAIGAGAGFIGGAALTGNESHQPKRKEIGFSAAARVAKAAAKGYAKGWLTTAPLIVPGTGQIGAVIGGIHAGVKEYRKITAVPRAMKDLNRKGMKAIHDDGLTGRQREIIGRLQMRPTTRMSAKGDILRFEVSPLQNLRNKLRPEEKSTAAHDIATGSLEGSVGSLAFVPVEHKVMHGQWKNPFLNDAGKFSKSALAKRLAVGGVIGGVATGLIGAGVSAASKKKRDSEPVFSAKQKLIQLGVSISGAKKVMRSLIPATVKRPVTPFAKMGAMVNSETGNVIVPRLPKGLNLPKSHYDPVATAMHERAHVGDPTLGKAMYMPEMIEQERRANGRVLGQLAVDSPGDVDYYRGWANRQMKDGYRNIGYAQKKKTGMSLSDKKKMLRENPHLMAKNVNMASKFKPIHFDMIAPGTRTRVATDRYVKQIHERDMDRTESGYLRTGAGGAAIGALTAKRFGATKGKAAMIGGLAGLGTQAIVRQSTKGTRDQFGDRSFNGKRADRAPSQIAGIAALGLAGKAAHDKLQAAKIAAQGMARKAKLAGLGALGLWGASKLFSEGGSNDLIQFAREPESPEYLAWKQGMEANQNESRDWRKSKTLVNKATQGVKRGTALVKDVVRAAKGQKNLDSRGRERKREWDKPWVRNLVTGGIGVGTLAVFHKAMRGTGPGSGLRNVKEVFDNGQLGEAVGRKVPGFNAVRSVIKKVRGQAGDEAASASEGIGHKIANWARANSAPVPKSTADITGAQKRAEEAAKQRLKGILKSDPKAILDYSSKSPIISLAAEDWESRSEGDLLKIAKIRRRNRAEKPFYKKENFENAVTIPALMGGSFVSGGLAAQLYAKRGGVEVPKSSPTPGGGAPYIPHAGSAPFMNQADKTKVIQGVFQNAKKVAKGVIKHHSLDPLIELNSILDAALT